MGSSTSEQFELGVAEALRAAQRKANEEGRSIRVGNRWVNPSSASLARRPNSQNKAWENFRSDIER